MQPQYGQPQYGQPQGQPMYMQPGQQQPVMYTQQPQQPQYNQAPIMAQPVAYSQPQYAPQPVYVDAQGRPLGQTVLIQQQQPIQQQPTTTIVYAGPSRGCCGCTPHTTAGWLNYILLFMLIGGWIACIVVFSSGLHEVRTSNNTVVSRYFWDRVKSPSAGTTVRYDDINSSSECAAGGKGFISIAAICFVTLIAYISILINRLRRVGMFGSLPLVAPIAAEIQKLASIELILAVISFGLFIAGVGCWSGSCLKITLDAYNGVGSGFGYVVVSTGFGYWIWVMVSFIGVFIHSIMIAQNPFYQNPKYHQSVTIQQPGSMPVQQTIITH